MDVRELYTKIGGNYDELLTRFGNETRVKRFLGLFLKDPSVSELKAAVAVEDWPTAFRAVHTLKGVAGNMSFTKLQHSASDLTEMLRNGGTLTDQAVYQAVIDDYALVLEGVQEYLATNP